ncbi:MAG: 3'-5' exonuclease, partial [Sphingobacteriales bacterium]
VKKSRSLKLSKEAEPQPDQLFTEKAGIFSEFAKVVCIGIGCLAGDAEQPRLVLKSLTHDDEKVLLNKFCDALVRFTERFPDLRFCGHNIREFDIPFLSRRMVIHNMYLPSCMQWQGKKPWEINILDTLDLWKFGDHKHYTSLDLLAEVLGIPSPKDDIDGSMVGEVYWKEQDLNRIARYCTRDVLTTAKVYLRLSGNGSLRPEPQIVED